MWTNHFSPPEIRLSWNFPLKISGVLEWAQISRWELTNFQQYSQGPGSISHKCTSFFKKIINIGSSHHGAVVNESNYQLGTMRLQVRSLALLSGLMIQHCCELWCRSQTRLGSCIAVALAYAGDHSSNWTPSLWNSICHGSGPRKGKLTKKKKKVSKLEKKR